MAAVEGETLKVTYVSLLDGDLPLPVFSKMNNKWNDSPEISGRGPDAYTKAEWKAVWKVVLERALGLKIQGPEFKPDFALP